MRQQQLEICEYSLHFACHLSVCLKLSEKLKENSDILCSQGLGRGTHTVNKIKS